MRNIQREHVFTNVPATGNPLNTETVQSFTAGSKGQIISYFVSAASTLWTIQIYKNNIPEKSLNIEGNLIPLFIDMEQNDQISVKVTNGDTTAQSCVVMILAQEY